MSPPSAWLQELRDALPRDAVVDDPDVVSGYSRDMAMLAPNGRPAAVVFPANTVEVSAVLRIASAHRIPVVPRGSGSGLAGSSNGVDGAALEQLGSTLIDDVAVPRSKISEFLDRTTEVARMRGVIIGVVGHAGDGNMHPTVCFDPSDADQYERAFAAFNDILEAGLSLGETITGEHGVGNLKTDWLAREIGPVGLRAHAAIKAALDPLEIMNPGKVFASQAAVAPIVGLAAVGR